MTTICTDGLSMAADSRGTTGDIVTSSKAKKLHRLPDGSIIGSAGVTKDCLRAIDAIADGKEYDGDYTLLRLMPDGKVLKYECCTYGMESELPATIGTGREVALGAMLAGANPKRAVTIAASCDVYTGGDVSVLRPRKPKK